MDRLFVVIPILLFLALILFLIGVTVSLKTKGIGPPPPSRPRSTEPPTIDNPLLEAHLAIRGVGCNWRGDVHMWCLFYLPERNNALHPDDGYLVFVAREATLSGWLNGCDALQFHRLRRDQEGNIMSSQNIDPVTGQTGV